VMSSQGCSVGSIECSSRASRISIRIGNHGRPPGIYQQPVPVGMSTGTGPWSPNIRLKGMVPNSRVALIEMKNWAIPRAFQRRLSSVSVELAFKLTVERTGEVMESPFLPGVERPYVERRRLASVRLSTVESMSDVMEH
jgi:hypothetical protein